MNKIIEKICIKIAWMIPRKLAYWCFIRVASAATMTEENRSKTPDEISIMDALKGW